MNTPAPARVDVQQDMRSLLAVLFLLTACGPDDGVDCSLVGHVWSCGRGTDGGVECVDAGWSKAYADDWNDRHPGVCRGLPDASIAP